MKTTDKVQTENTTSTTTTSSQWQTYNHYNAEQGWECPRCGRINAPWVRQCDCSKNNWTITCNDWICKPEWDWWKTYVTSNQADTNGHTTDTWSAVGGSDYWDTNSHSYVNTPPCATNTIHDGKLKYKEK